jgi:bacteriorhodopsin
LFLIYVKKKYNDLSSTFLQFRVIIQFIALLFPPWALGKQDVINVQQDCAGVHYSIFTIQGLSVVLKMVQTQPSIMIFFVWGEGVRSLVK